MWYKNNHLPVNTLKTFYMLSASIRKLRDLRNADFNSRTLFDNENLSQVDNCIYLGISLDSDLKWESQVKRIAQNVSL